MLLQETHSEILLSQLALRFDVWFNGYFWLSLTSLFNWSHEKHIGACVIIYIHGWNTIRNLNLVAVTCTLAKYFQLPISIVEG